jgi:uncharacterized protein
MNFPTVLKAALAASILGTPWAFGDVVADSVVIGVHENQEKIGVSDYNKGLDYTLGRGVPKDEVEAVKWFRIAAKQGNAEAQSELGFAYQNGKGVHEDRVEAAKWFRLAAEQGNAKAQTTLGFAYQMGIGVQKNHVEAVKWFRMASEQGVAPAQYVLGVIFQDGIGVPKDEVEAVKWFRMAAEQGDAGAQHNVGVAYANGDGVQQDFTEAAKWYRLAAAQGDADAQARLAFAYQIGRGVPKDDVEAHKWFNRSADQGNEESARNRDSLANQMTAEQIAEAQIKRIDKQVEEAFTKRGEPFFENDRAALAWDIYFKTIGPTMLNKPGLIGGADAQMFELAKLMGVRPYDAVPGFKRSGVKWFKEVTYCELFKAWAKDVLQKGGYLTPQGTRTRVPKGLENMQRNSEGIPFVIKARK